MRFLWRVAILLLTLESAVSGQRLYWGVIGGTGLTPDFPLYDTSGPADSFGNAAFHFQHLPGPHSLILGGLLEVQLTNSFAIEADILHRPLRATLIDTLFPANGPSVTTKLNYKVANTWEFPLMLKWNLPSALEAGRIRPFVEGGVAFRTSQDLSGVQPSQFGVTAGVGAAIQLGKLRLSPSIRYTRWDKETVFPPYPTKADQLEFLASLAWGTSSAPLQLKGHKVSLGVLGGFSPNGEFYYPNSGVRVRAEFLVGASAQVDLREGLAIEADAVYKPLRNSFGVGNRFTVLTWDFPVLAKYRVPKLGRAAFVEAGPSFRSSGNLNGYNPSHFGVTAGAGVEGHAGAARLSTALRYTRWVKDAYGYGGSPPADYARTNANAVELILGFGF